MIGGPTLELELLICADETKEKLDPQLSFSSKTAANHFDKSYSILTSFHDIIAFN